MYHRVLIIILLGRVSMWAKQREIIHDTERKSERASGMQKRIRFERMLPFRVQSAQNSVLFRSLLSSALSHNYSIAEYYILYAAQILAFRCLSLSTLNKQMTSRAYESAIVSPK